MGHNCPLASVSVWGGQGTPFASKMIPSTTRIRLPSLSQLDKTLLVLPWHNLPEIHNSTSITEKEKKAKSTPPPTPVPNIVQVAGLGDDGSRSQRKGPCCPAQLRAALHSCSTCGWEVSSCDTRCCQLRWRKTK